MVIFCHLNVPRVSDSDLTGTQPVSVFWANLSASSLETVLTLSRVVAELANEARLPANIAVESRGHSGLLLAYPIRIINRIKGALVEKYSCDYLVCLVIIPGK